MVKHHFVISGTSDRFWNRDEFIRFLAEHQGHDIELSVDPEAVCFDSLGVYRLLDIFCFESVHILTRNPLAGHDRYLTTILPNQWFPKLETVDPDLHDWSGKKIFFALFGRPTAARLGLAAYLIENHESGSLLHFSANTDDDHLIQFELDKLLEYDLQAIEPVGKLIKRLPMLLSSLDRYTSTNGYDFGDPLTNLYRDILIDIVVESHVKGKTFFPTEKTLRPIWLKKPFVVFASKNFLEYLRQMGFRTFSDFWSEDYDGYEGRDRFIKILDLINNLASKSQKQLTEMYWDMKYTLDYNFDLLQSQKFSIDIREIS